MGFVRLLVAAAPLAVLLGGIVWLRWRAYRAAAAGWFVAALGASLFFGAGPALVAYASAKGLSLALLVLLIVWAAVFLYSLMDDLEAVQVIAGRIMQSTRDPVLLALLVGWAFAGFIQGIAGFGVPVAIIAPLMLLAGLPPVRAIAVAMIGPTWAITFGSMGSAFYAIRLVTGLDERVLGPALALLSFLPICLTGISVAHIAGGWTAVRHFAHRVFLATGAMVAVMWGLTSAGAAPLASMLSGLAGALVLGRVGHATLPRWQVKTVTQHSTPALSFSSAFLPYAVFTLLAIAGQVPAVKTTATPLRLALSFPAQSTSRGFTVDAIEAYAPIQLVGHPAPLLLVSALVTFFVFRKRGIWRAGAPGRALQSTVRQTKATTFGVSLMLMMALVVADSGMAAALAEGAAALGGKLYFMASPLIGLLGAFVTGSSTNSNVMFGPLQLYASRTLAISTVLVAAAQILGGSIGSGIAPDKALIGVSVVRKEVQEGEVMRQALPYAVGIVVAIGIEMLIVSTAVGG